jgi:RNA polymerase sigma-B factor
LSPAADHHHIVTNMMGTASMLTATHNTHDEYQPLLPLFDQLTGATLPDDERTRVRDLLVTGHLPLARHIAWKFRNRGQPDDDLLQVATLGLIHAVDRFDPTRSVSFLSFAVPTITGEIRRYFRDSTWTLRVPRSLKELHASIAEATTRLGQQLGRAPRPSELAADLGIPVDKVNEGLQAGFAYSTDSLDEPGTDGYSPAEGHLGQIDHSLGLVEDRATLDPALARLPEREARIVVMRFVDNLTQSQIAERVGLSQMHVSRLLAASLRTLRKTIEQDAAPDRV